MYDLGDINDYEKAGLELLKPELKASIDKARWAASARLSAVECSVLPRREAFPSTASGEVRRPLSLQEPLRVCNGECV